jgi:alanine-glyoxylate transaminase/serine-glyoxylate transaminase/serine-pyruvate transaminase
VVIPAGTEDGAARKRMLDEFGLEIGAGLGPLAGKIWRIGLMGQASTPKNVNYCLSVLTPVLA